MATVAKVLIALAALSFLGAVVAASLMPILGLPAESFSRAASNLALLAIALLLLEGRDAGVPRAAGD